ncbi:MAG: ATP-binding protein [bacterium]
MYTRIIQKSIEKWLFKSKIVIVYGPRQAGKTTLAKAILEKFGDDGLYLNCEVDSVRRELSKIEPVQLKSFFGQKKIIVLDEAQVIPNIGLVLKTFIDEYKEIQIIATGSSSFDLVNNVKEPLTGRSIEFTLLPFSVGEIIVHDKMPSFKSYEETFFRFGSYPNVYNNKDSQEIMQREIENIQSNYLYKDILTLGGIRKPKILEDMLQLLAFQIGNEVSLNELAVKLGTSVVTVDRYIDLLEKTFVIYRLRALSRNQRNEIRGNFKVYFIDIGIRNAIIHNFNSLSLRDDIGRIFENIFIIERLKKAMYAEEFKNYFFWRTYDQREIDFIEEDKGVFSAFECKYSEGNIKNITKDTFLKSYPKSDLAVVSKNNYLDFLI